MTSDHGDDPLTSYARIGEKEPKTHLYHAEHAAIVRMAEARLALDEAVASVGAVMVKEAMVEWSDACRAAAMLIPVVACRACGTGFVQGDARRRFFCSDRCRYRVGKRESRAAAAARAALAHPPSVAGEAGE